MAKNVCLTLDLERFAKDCVANGRFNGVIEVTRPGLRLVQKAGERPARLTRMLDDVSAEADRDGDHAVEEVLAKIDAIIGEPSRAARGEMEGN